MAARNRLPPWHEQLRLANGRDVLIRPIRPDDAGPLRAGFALLQPDEIRQRFLHAMTELTPEMAERLARPDTRRAFAVVAAEPLPPGEALVGALARLTRDDDRESAEFAILVSHFVSGQGLGLALMRRLVEWAEAHGIRRIWGDVLDENTGMIALAQAMGFQREMSPESPNLLRITLDLAPAKRLPRR